MIVYFIKMTIPNILHFVYGCKPQTQEFLFLDMTAILSAKAVHKPDTIYLHYFYEPYGKYWDILKSTGYVTLMKMDNMPTHIGKKEIKQYQHIGDIIRLNSLKKYGGAYLDIDTISVNPFGELLNNQFVMAKQYNMGLCNAIMLSEPNAKFVDIWLKRYENFFKEDGWGESSITLPMLLARSHPEHITVCHQDIFFTPCCNEAGQIFKDNTPENPRITTLHVWRLMHGDDYLNYDWKWMKEHPNALFTRYLNKALEQDEEVKRIYEGL